MKFGTSVPMLETNDIQATIEFYTKQLGFTLAEVWPSQEEVCWCLLHRDQCTFMFTLGSDETESRGTAMTGSIYCYPEDVDAFWAEVSTGLKAEFPLDDRDYGMRDVGFRDNNGYLLFFGQPMEAES